MDDLEDLSRRAARAQNGADPTRARPDPWFVGSNARLAAVVIGVVALLIVARLITSVWMIEEVWTWWRHRPAPTQHQQSAGFRADQSPPAQVGKAAAARGDEREWITADDYPAEAMLAGEQGRTGITWTIGVDGRVRDCHVVSSSGYPRLDAAGCIALTRRARYNPARDLEGRPIATRKSRSIVWKLPEG